MKYKTLFRMLMKAIGVWVFVEGLNGLLSQVGYIVFTFTNANMRASGQGWYFLWNIVSQLMQLGIGAYLFFGGKWIADLAIPGNRPYCHECGYDLTNAAGNVCTECGTAFRPVESSAP
jgi:hypothetical protein